MILNNHDIARELERMLEKEFCCDYDHSGTIFSADSIEMRSFYDVLYLLLYMKGKRDYCNFIDSIYDYKGKSMQEIPNCKGIYEEFLSFL